MFRSTVLALTLAALATAADAGPRHVLAMARVEVGDLDLETASGSAKMLRRLDTAAEELCRGTRSSLLPRQSAMAWRCRRDAVNAAVERLRTPALMAAYHAWLSAGPDADPQARNPG